MIFLNDTGCASIMACRDGRRDRIFLVTIRAGIADNDWNTTGVLKSTRYGYSFILWRRVRYNRVFHYRNLS